MGRSPYHYAYHKPTIVLTLRLGLSDSRNEPANTELIKVHRSFIKSRSNSCWDREGYTCAGNKGEETGQYP
jgi:hypothetical protein